MVEPSPYMQVSYVYLCMYDTQRAEEWTGMQRGVGKSLSRTKAGNELLQYQQTDQDDCRWHLVGEADPITRPGTLTHSASLVHLLLLLMLFTRTNISDIFSQRKSKHLVTRPIQQVQHEMHQNWHGRGCSGLHK